MKNIICRILLIPKAARASYLFVEAWDAVARNDPQKADRLFGDAECILGKIPTREKIMQGYVKFRLRDRESCVNLFKEAWLELDGDENISVHDKQYLKSYMSDIIIVYEKFAGYKFGLPLIYMSEIDLSKASHHIKSLFPMRDHLDWEKYGA